ncbi:MAG: D-hexose-6-phosphate mutarotase [Micropruina sp.]|uniref:D-hexose-6-phosphate mutarotase n=1 Tax=Micropruina sp. TaxID=2737536 RepID=UPI0039E51B63
MSHTEITAPLPGIEDAAGRCRIFDHGAHVARWQPEGSSHPVLWLSSASAYTAGKAIRGGIPICFPWFGPGLTGDKKPAHGFVRAIAWRRSEVVEDGDTLRVSYTIDPEITGRQPEFPHPYQARLTAEFAAAHLAVTLWARNTGDQPFTIEEALHTYLAVSDVREIAVDGLDGAVYLDKNLPEPAFDQVQSGSLRLTGPTDRVHLHGGAVTVSDPGYARRIRLSTEGSADVVVWNPWEEAAAGLADMPPGEWSGMVCVEAANVFADAVTLLPGEDWTMTQRIDVLGLDD